MSGHSKWHQIKRKKEATDAKRGQKFTHLAAQIKQAARSNPNPATNPALNEAISRAKRANMPQANIDRLLGQTDSPPGQTIIYEAFGPGGTALLIVATTDNSRRTVAEVRAILKKHGVNLSEPGSVAWKFELQPDQGYTAKYPQTTNPANQEKTNCLLKELKKHPDIEQVFSDAAETVE